jgi:tetratricopeptide (TPR) repeat protein
MKQLLLAGAFCLALNAGAAAREKLPGPLLPNLGTLQHPVSTASSRAQRYFDQGLILLYGFNHPEAIRSFRSAAHLDPRCAMAYWGVAYAYGPHVNRPMTPEDTAAAWTALREAVARASAASPREQAYLAALEKRYQAEHTEDRAALDRAFADAMREVVQRYPDDLDAQTLFAEALMNTMPWDYWTGDRSPKPETEEALAALRHVLARNPDHPGANHLFIHAVEAGPTPALGLPSADRLRLFAPGAGHLVHMPSHIYIRVGQYRDATLANERAIQADQEYLRSCRAQGFYPGVYYPHNLHFLWWAQLFEGRSAEALRTARKVARYANDNYCGPSKAVEAPRLRHLPWLTLARFGQWRELLAIPEPAAKDDFLVDRVLWHFARGLALVATGQAEAAASEHAALVEWTESEAVRQLDSPIFPVSNTLAVPRHWLAAKIAGARGDQTGLVQELEHAVAAEDALPYMEPTFWPVPVRPALGVAWLQAGEPARAEAVFRQDLERLPRNPWGLLGLEASLRHQGKVESAELVRRQFDAAWQHADTRLQLDWF